MPTARSAGFVLFHDDEGTRKYLLLQHTHGAHWNSPKGTIEDGETLKDTAVRELFEETGISQVEFIEGFEEVQRYSFTVNGQLVDKEVFYFLARTRQKAVTLSWEHLAYRWLSFEKAVARLTYENSRDLLRKAEAFLSQRAIASRGSPKPHG